MSNWWWTNLALFSEIDFIIANRDLTLVVAATLASISYVWKVIQCSKLKHPAVSLWVRELHCFTQKTHFTPDWANSHYLLAFYPFFTLQVPSIVSFIWKPASMTIDSRLTTMWPTVCTEVQGSKVTSKSHFALWLHWGRKSQRIAWNNIWYA